MYQHIEKRARYSSICILDLQRTSLKTVFDHTKIKFLQDSVPINLSLRFFFISAELETVCMRNNMCMGLWNNHIHSITEEDWKWDANQY